MGDSGLLFGWTFEVWLGVVGFIIGTVLGIMQLADYIRPTFSIISEKRTITSTVEPKKRYTFVNLIIGVSLRDADLCELYLTREGEGINLEDMRLNWCDPRPDPQGRTHQEATLSIHRGIPTRTNIFEIYENEIQATTHPLDRRDIIWEVGRVYDCKFRVIEQPRGNKVATFRINIKAWNNIDVDKISRWCRA